MNTSRPVLCPYAYDVARTVEVYQTRLALRCPTLSSHLPHMYTVGLLPRCGAPHGDIKRQGADIFASTEFNDTFQRRS